MPAYNETYDLRGKRIKETYQNLLQYNEPSESFFTGQGAEINLHVALSDSASHSEFSDTSNTSISSSHADYSNVSISSSYSPVEPRYSSSVSTQFNNYSSSAATQFNSYSSSVSIHTSSWSRNSISSISASWASASISASYAPVEPDYSASVAISKQNTLVVGGTYLITASSAVSASWAPMDDAPNSVSSSWASHSLSSVSSSWAPSSFSSTTSSFASSSFSSTTASYSSTSFSSTTSSWASQSFSSTSSSYASFSLNSVSASWASQSLSSSTLYNVSASVNYIGRATFKDSLSITSSGAAGYPHDAISVYNLHTHSESFSVSYLGGITGTSLESDTITGGNNQFFFVDNDGQVYVGDTLGDYAFIDINGRIQSPGITSSLRGNADTATSASWASASLSASWAPTSSPGTTLYTASTYPITSSWANDVTSASWASQSFTVDNGLAHVDANGDIWNSYNILSTNFANFGAGSLTIDGITGEITASSIIMKGIPGIISASQVTSSLFGTASNAVSASWAPGGDSTYSVSASWASQSLSASIISNGQSWIKPIDDSVIMATAGNSTVFTFGYAGGSFNLSELPISASEITAALFGTASNAVSASWAPTGTATDAVSASWASSSLNAASASIAQTLPPNTTLNNLIVTGVLNHNTGDFFVDVTGNVGTVGTFTATSSAVGFVGTSSWATNVKSASWASSSLTSATASWANNVTSASWASRSFAATSASWASASLTATSASYSQTASFALNGGGSGTTLYTGSTYPITASWALNTVNGGTGSIIISDIDTTTQSFDAGDGVHGIPWNPAYTKQLITSLPFDGMYRLNVVSIGVDSTPSGGFWGFSGSGIIFAASFVDENGAYSVVDDGTGSIVNYGGGKGFAMGGPIYPGWNNSPTPDDNGKFRYFFSQLFSGKAGQPVEYSYSSTNDLSGSLHIITKASIELLTP